MPIKRREYNIEVDDEYRLTMEQREWMYANKIRRYSWFTDDEGIRYISFRNEEDAVAFKLGCM